MAKYITPLLSLILLLTPACTEEKVIPITGSIAGIIYMVDEEGYQIENRTGIRVSLSEKHFAETDDRGYFEIHDIQRGTYKLTLEKEGFGTVVRYNTIIAGGNVPAIVSDITLFQLPSLELLSHTVDVEENTVTVSGEFTNTSFYNFVYYFGDNPDVSNINYEYHRWFTLCCKPMTTFTHTIQLEGKSSRYMVAYAGSKANNNPGGIVYHNPEAGVTVDPSEKKLFDAVKLW